ncbi:hypothetical protein SNOG_13546 [Parastagonospora nodorum SN15]|uniref:Uncharacterized protein n=1 Tax=Phaeosphaeria nodorum (strain SN15 / ATCC MYA-4574 / FGSC 10173) TaxID=321614 RepID=Q0U3W8_PHANO|nr:hypothetical protein SNOG_13546 [Parastagonospora nodorum SN15]EAT78993.1 hypothetical protein SNOG_13546 [Parastagonospora nodorum SN15]
MAHTIPVVHRLVLAQLATTQTPRDQDGSETLFTSTETTSSHGDVIMVEKKYEMDLLLADTVESSPKPEGCGTGDELHPIC